MKHTPQRHRIAIAALSAALVLPIAPVFGQAAPAASAPPVVTVSPPPPVFVAPPPPVSTAPAPVARPQPAPARAAPAPTTTARTVTRTTRAAPARPRAQAPVRRTAPPPAAAPIATAPTPAPVAAAPVVAPVPAPAEPVVAPVETPAATGGSMLPWLLAGGALLLALIGFFALRRRRASDEVYEEAYEEPAIAAPEPSFSRPIPEPSMATATPAAAAVAAEADDAEVEDAAPADVAALAEDSEPVAGRPWLEFLLRPVRAGTSQDDAIVQFELTIGNTGTVSATDVKISTWMFAAGQGSEMERSLIDPPAGATVSEVDIAAGDGARVDGEFALPKSGLSESVLPVVVADARYRLPDGSEGRTSASFAIGMAEGDALMPFPIDRASGLLEDVEARLHGEPQRT